MRGILGKWWLWLILAAVLAGGGFAVYTFTRPVYTIQVSPETTYLTEPLREDGTVDYRAVVEANAALGVTAKNNAAPVLIQALGPDLLPESVRAELLADLGGLSPKGPYLVSLEAFLKARAQSQPASAPATLPAGKPAVVPASAPASSPASMPASNPASGPSEAESENAPPAVPEIMAIEEDQSLGTADLPQRERDFLRVVSEAPWSAKRYPILAEFLQTNEKPLDLIVQASTRGRLYLSMLAGDSRRLTDVQWPDFSPLTEAAQCLAARSMARFGAGDANAGTEDLLAIHRLARLLAQGPAPAWYAEATQLEKLAFRAEKGLAASEKLLPWPIKQLLHSLDAVGPLPPPSGRVLLCQRLTALDALAIVAVEGLPRARAPFAPPGPLPPAKRETGIDCSSGMKAVNAAFDAAQSAYELNSFSLRQERFKAVESQLESARAQARADSVQSGELAGLSGQAALRVFKGVAVDHPGAAVLNWMRDWPACPDVLAVWQGYEMAMGGRPVAQVSLALGGFRRENKVYPLNLPPLLPEFFKELPPDHFSGKPVNYKKIGAGFVLYSVGPSLSGVGAADEPEELLQRVEK